MRTVRRKKGKWPNSLLISDVTGPWGETTFHFVDASAQDALVRAFDAAGGRDVRIGGGVATVRQFLEADLIDTMHIAVAPVELGRGERLWVSPDELGCRLPA